MRILYFSRDYTTHDFRFLTSLAETEHQVFSLRLEGSNRSLEDRVLPPSVSQIHWVGGQGPVRRRDILKLLGGLKKVIQQVKPDLIHAGPVPSCAFLAAWSGFHPLVSMSWGSDLLRDVETDAWQRWAAQIALQRSDLFFGDCQAVVQKAQTLGLSADRSVTFPWGINLDAFHPARNVDFRARLGWQDAFVLLSLRSWEPIYGVDVIVNAFAQAVAQQPQLRLVLLGSGSQANLIESLLDHAGIRDKVYLGGQVGQQDLPGIYQAADLYLSASHSDGSSVSLMEALASGLPVVVSDIPGNKEWITPGKEGWLFADGNVDALSQSILQAVEKQHDLPEMRLNARAIAEERANWKENFQKMLAGYQSAREIALKHG